MGNSWDFRISRLTLLHLASRRHAVFTQLALPQLTSDGEVSAASDEADDDAGTENEEEE